jgi:Fe-S cluster assembly protein SufD
MNFVAPAAVPPGVAPFLSLFEEAASRGQASLRETAIRALLDHGLPTRRDEAWRKTPIASALATGYVTAGTPTSKGVLPLFLRDFTDMAALVAINGAYEVFRDRRTPYAAPGVQDLSLPALADTLPLVQLNAALSHHGATIAVPDGVDGDRILLALCADHQGETPLLLSPRHLVTVGAGAKLTLVEICAGNGNYFRNSVSRIEIASGGHLTHVRLLEDSTSAVSVSTIITEIAAGGTYDSFTLNLGGKLTRCEYHALMSGTGAAVHLNGAQILDGGQIGDITTVVTHAAPHCASRQTVKNVLSGQSRGVFQGRIEVDRIAQKTDGYQMNQALLLSPDAEIDAKPELQIFADDVKCSHGATVGALDPDQLFYLRSRGVPEAEARGLLVDAFIADALELVADAGIRDYLTARVTNARWERAQ